MRHVPFSEARRVDNGPSCKVHEYGGNEKIDTAFAEINGTYPELGWARNRLSDTSFFVHSGEGKFTVRYEVQEEGRYVTKEIRIALGERARVLVEAGELYRIEGDNLQFVVSSAPAWSSEQYDTVDDHGRPLD